MGVPSHNSGRTPRFGLLGLANRAHPHYDASGALRVREVEFEAVGKLVAHPRLGKGLADLGTIARQIPFQHVEFRFALDVPFGRQKAKSADWEKPGMMPLQQKKLRSSGTGLKSAQGAGDQIIGEKSMTKALRRAVIDPKLHVRFIAPTSRPLPSCRR